MDKAIWTEHSVALHLLRVGNNQLQVGVDWVDPQVLLYRY